MATDLVFSTGDIPVDETPPLEGYGGDFDPEFPGSTPNAPYGFKPNGEPYKRRPKGSGGTGTTHTARSNRMPASDKMARNAASLLGRLNSLIAIGLATANMPGTAAAMVENNAQFEEMAYEALLTDPQLCRKILGAGATSGKAGLVMAYGMLGVSLVPAAKSEIMSKRAEREVDAD